MKEEEEIEMNRRLNEASPLRETIANLKAVLAAEDVVLLVTCDVSTDKAIGRRPSVRFHETGIPQDVLRDHLAGALAKMEAEYAAI